jgi:simple sugar transport system ATP-binding protein
MSLLLSDIHKRYGPVHANDGITLEVEAGTLHGLLGENGAGKSTLMKVVSGFIEADSGTISLDGKELDLASPRDAIAAGIGMLHQDPLIFLPLSIIDNFLMSSPGGGLNLNRADGVAALKEASERFGFQFKPDAPARTLTVGERQQLEIVRLLWLGARVLILDEPTTGISEIQRVDLFATLRQLAAEGMIVIFVSHKLEEVEELCEKVTVMRQGRVVGESALPVPATQLVEMMFGQIIAESDRPPVDVGGANLVLDGVSVTERHMTMEDVSVSVATGEVVGLAGLEGSGQRLFLGACTGLNAPAKGSITLGGVDLAGKGYRAFLDSGVHYLPAGRLEEGLVAGLSIEEHLVLAGSDTAFFVDWDGAQAEAQDKIEHFSIKGFPDSAAESLSGGNQQRLLLSMMKPGLKLLLMEHPTRGLDIESADWVWTQLLARRAEGTSIIFASADLDELLRYSDRIIVFFNGRILRTVDASSTNGEELGYLIGGKVDA